jgi:tape measure domain-containing protein
MAVDAETLLIRLEATQRKFERQLAGANRTADRRARQIERRFERMNRRIGRSLSNTLTGLLPAVGGAALVQEFRQITDAATRIENALKVAGLEGEALTVVFDSLFESAQRNFVPLESLAELYRSASLAQEALGASTVELTNFTENVALALRVSGKSAAESRGALIQLSQAIGAGVVRAEEFNAILEGALPIAQAAARGLREAGGDVTRLRRLIIDGKVSSEAFFRAFEAGAPSLAEAVEDAEITSSQALTRLGNELIRQAGNFDKATGASESFVDAVEDVTDVIGPFTQFAAGMVNRLADITTAFERAKEESLLLRSIVNAINLPGRAIEIGQQVLTNRERLNPAVIASRREEIAVQEDERAFGGTFQPTQQGTVSLEDLPPDRSDNTSRRQERQNALEREIQQIRERTAALREETAVLADMGPFQDDYGAALERTRAVRELLTAAERAGIEVTPELEEQIGALADGYAAASVEAQKLAESQDAARQKAEEFASATKDALGGFISDIQRGTDATDALRNALGRVASQLADIALNSLSGGFGGSSGGGLQSIFSSFFGGARANGGPVSPDKFYKVGERGPELFVPDAPGRIVPNHALPGMASANTGGTVRLFIEEAPGFAARVRTEAEGVAVQVVRRDGPGIAVKGVSDYNYAGNRT